MLTSTDIEGYINNGYIIRDILTKNEIKTLKNAADELASRHEYQSELKLYQVSLLQPASRGHLMHHIIHHDKIFGVIEQILGPDLIIDNSAIFFANSRVEYKLGWHRDVLQIPEHFITDDWFSPLKFHNNVQLNLALEYDECFWIIPGSHIRPNSDEENIRFKSSKHLSPIETDMPHAMQIKLNPGQAIFYNNNAIHRGYTNSMINQRRTIHLGYHTATKEPTYHFSVLKYEEYTDEYLNTLSPEVKSILSRHILERHKFKDPYNTHVHHQKFLKEIF